MRTIRARCYGTPDVLTLEEIDRPTPEDDQVLVEVRAAGLNPSDWHRMEGKIPMLRQVYGDPEPTDHAVGTDCALENTAGPFKLRGQATELLLRSVLRRSDDTRTVGNRHGRWLRSARLAGRSRRRARSGGSYQA